MRRFGGVNKLRTIKEIRRADRISLTAVWLVALLFGAFATMLVWEQSFIAIDGQRYFNVADDALITLRYGWNLAHGDGLVWNPGEHVEGITNLAWAVWGAALAAVLDKRLLPFGIQLTAVVLLIVTAFAFRQIFRRLTGKENGATKNPIVEIVAFALPLSYVPLVSWSLFGMETSLVAALVALAVARLVSPAPCALGSTLLGVAFLARPDAAVPAVTLIGMRVLRRWGQGGALTAFIRDAFPFLTIVVGASVFRYAYYGAVVPNTYTLKASGIPLLERVEVNGIPYVTPLLDISAPVLIALFVSLVARPAFEKLLLAALPVGMFVYTVYVGGDAFPDFRFTAPYLPYAYLVLLLDCPLISRWIGTFDNTPTRSLKPERLFTAVVVALFALDLWRQPFSLARVPQGDNVANTNTALYLLDKLAPNASVGVFYAGAIPYYTGRKAIDFLGKNDPYIARLPPDMSGRIAWGGMRSVPGHNKYDLNYSILGRRPTYVAGFKYGAQDVTQQAVAYYESVPVNFTTWPEHDPHAVLLLRTSLDVLYPSAESVRSGNGLFDLERDGSGQTWRWVGQKASVLLKNRTGPGLLRIRAEVPLDHVTVRLDLGGKLLDTFVTDSGKLEKEYEVDRTRLNSGEWTELLIQTDKALRTPDDRRARGLRVFEIVWKPR